MNSEQNIPNAEPGGSSGPQRSESSLAEINSAIQTTQIDMALHQVAAAALGRVAFLYSRIEELAACGPAGTAARGPAATEEIAQLNSEIAAIAEGTEFSSEKIFQGEFQIPLLSAGFSPDGLSSAIERVALLNNEVASAINIIGSVLDKLKAHLKSLTSYRSAISDADYAFEIANLTKNMLMDQACELADESRSAEQSAGPGVEHDAQQVTGSISPDRSDE